MSTAWNAIQTYRHLVVANMYSYAKNERRKHVFGKTEKNLSTIKYSPIGLMKKRHTSVCHAKNNQIFWTLCWKSCENCWDVMRYTKILPKNEITGKQINIFRKYADSNKKGNRSACESYKLSLTHSEVCVCLYFLAWSAKGLSHWF